MVMAVQTTMVQNSTPKNFFVALANSTPMTGTVVNQTAISNQQCAFTATNLVTSQESVHSKESHLQQSAHQKNRCQNQHEVNSSQSSVINEVEYSFDIINNYETETGKTLINVKGNLRRNVEFWKNVLCANDFIINTINLGYRIPFCEKLHFKCITPMFRLPERIIYSDASEYAGAGFTVGDNHIVHFMWDKEDRIKSSTWRELKAVKNILESLQLMLCGKLVKLYTDNQNVVKIVQKGSMKLDLQVISLDIFHICLNNNIVLESQWKQFEDYANNPRLASVIDVLPSIIESSKAKSTNNKYRIYFEKFRKWCVLFGLQYSPATSTTISLYIGGLIQQGISVSVLESNYYSIKWHHDKNFKDNPCSDEFLSLILEGGKRILIHLNVLDKCVCTYNMLVYNVIKHCLLEKKKLLTV
ncbi:unnamed protein product [Mytilus edulis]|uniref:RNase H type-1 domain-containing protein n=1 Tax=Mytilus edulis TaxID=6550 RepID=A0A8S3QF28_MYTED|nr:unnamed protein product [Mytilus edulis]